MKPRISSRLGAAVLAGLVAVVPVAGAVAVAQPAAAGPSVVVAEDAVVPIQPISEDIVPVSGDVEQAGSGFPWILAANLVGATVVVGGALVVMHRNDKRLGRR